MACVAMAYIVMAFVVMAYIVMAYIVMAYIVMAYEVMALDSAHPSRPLRVCRHPCMHGGVPRQSQIARKSSRHAITI